MRKNKSKEKRMIVFPIVVLIIVIILTIVIVSNKGETSKSESIVAENNETTYIEYPDVDKYFEENAEVLDILPVNESKTILTEDEVITELKNRGFTEININTEYSMNGDYIEEQKVEKGNENQHPMYIAQYLSANNDLWTITITNNQITATPISYQLQTEITKPILIAENNTLTSYDSLGNRYFITKPNEASVTVKQVEKIDANTLDNLTAEEIEKL